MTRDQERALKDAVEAINPIKARLLDQYNNLMRAGLTRKAQSLDTIIARLEAWQR
jgi:hypothetical protein